MSDARLVVAPGVSGEDCRKRPAPAEPERATISPFRESLIWLSLLHTQRDISSPEGKQTMSQHQSPPSGLNHPSGYTQQQAPEKKKVRVFTWIILGINVLFLAWIVFGVAGV